MCDDDIDEDFLLEALEEVESIINPSCENIQVHYSPSRPNSHISRKSSEAIPVYQKTNEDILELTTTKTAKKQNVRFQPPIQGVKKAKQDIASLACDDKILENQYTERTFNISKQQNPSQYFKNDTKLQINRKIELENENHSGRPNYKDNQYILSEKSSLQGTSNLHSSIPKSIIRKRKFPGPAGLLPNMNSALGPGGSFNNFKTSFSQNNKSINDLDEPLCSQTPINDSNVEVYNVMHGDVERICQSKALNRFNVRWLNQQRKRNFRSQKIPVLAVTIRSIDFTHLYVDAVFKDQTGEIKGDIDKIVIEKYSSILVAGSGILLKNLGVLARLGSTSSLPNHYLNITLNSIVSIYSRDEELGLKITYVNMLEAEELERLIKLVETKTTNDLFTEEDETINSNRTVIHSGFDSMPNKVNASPRFASPRPSNFSPTNNRGGFSKPRSGMLTTALKNNLNNLTPVRNANSIPTSKNLPSSTFSSKLKDLKANIEQKTASDEVISKIASTSSSKESSSKTANSLSDDEMDDLLNSIDTDIYYQ